MQVMLDDRDGRRAFQAPRRVIRADRTDQVPGALAALEAARSEGAWLAGWFGYELGYALEPRLSSLMPADADPLICFGVFDGPCAAPDMPSGRAYAGPLVHEWDGQAYAARFARVKDALGAGDIYQANLSFRSRFAFAGAPRALYESLRAASAAPHCAYVDDGARQILSLSPELFFEIENGVIRARPMKGTRPREGADDAGRAALAASAKDRAENLMIVDLIRNDLGRVARTGSVGVENMFAVETYPTLHTMVSTVTAALRPGTGIAQIVAALFPCGSVTGAPKIRAMEILRGLEVSPRGAYCGAVGVFAPNGDARFNVAIRTLTIAGGAGTLGIGGGVVQDSGAAAEYAECLLKARFFTDMRAPIALIETLRFEDGFVRLDRHLARMAASARLFGLDFDADAARRALEDAVAGSTGGGAPGKESPLRLRLTLDEAGVHAAAAALLPSAPPIWRYAVSRERVASADLLLRHKTSWRTLYDAEAARHGTDEVIFLNERGELAEGARSNVFLRRGGQLLTPALSCGLLPGCLRAELLETGACAEAVLVEADLRDAESELFFGNSLRGLIPARPG